MAQAYRIFLLVLLTLELPASDLSGDESPLRIAVVQLEVDLDVYSSVESFKGRIRSVVSKASREHDPDLLIFPEYTGALIALIPYSSMLASSAGYEEAFRRLRLEKPHLESIKELLLEEADFVLGVVNQVFGDLAREFGVYILGGTYFARLNGGQELRNRAVVYDAGGNLVYSQDKVILTDFEKEVLGLSAGTYEEATGFTVGARDISLSICRDTFSREWEDRYSGKDLWIDVKAHGARYERSLFDAALPARIAASDVPYGITACLTGKLLDLFWEGKSSLVAKRPEGAVFLRKASSSQNGELIFLSLPE
jgi:predicted amidohydrolase